MGSAGHPWQEVRTPRHRRPHRTHSQIAFTLRQGSATWTVTASMQTAPDTVIHLILEATRMVSWASDCHDRPEWISLVTVTCEFACIIPCAGGHCTRNPLDARGGPRPGPTPQASTNRLTNQPRLAATDLPDRNTTIQKNRIELIPNR